MPAPGSQLVEGNPARPKPPAPLPASGSLLSRRTFAPSNVCLCFVFWQFLLSLPSSCTFAPGNFFCVLFFLQTNKRLLSGQTFAPGRSCARCPDRRSGCQRDNPTAAATVLAAQQVRQVVPCQIFNEDLLQIYPYPDFSGSPPATNRQERSF